MTLVIDASVAWKWLVRENDSDLAESLLSGVDPLVAPALVVAEICNAAWKSTQRGELSAAQAERIAADIAGQFDELVPLPRLAGSATALAISLQHPVYDCFYLVLAEDIGATLITADSRLVNKTRRTRWASRVSTLVDHRG